MPRFFLEEIDENHICITGPDAHHIGFSLRMRPGEKLTVCANGTDYDCEITEITGEEVYLKCLSAHLCAAEPSVEVTLYQAMPKSDKLEQIIQKSVELGVTKIVPVLTRRCICRPNEKQFQKKLQRLQSISAAAAKQSGRGIIPQIEEMHSFNQVLKELDEYDDVLMFYENGGEKFQNLNLEQSRKIAIFIGSEGGIDPEEAEQLKQAGATSVWLGNRILRCETAPITALSVLMHVTGNL